MGGSIYHLMETCVPFTPPREDMIPYGDIIQCSIRGKNPKKQCVRMLKLNNPMSPEGSISHTKATLTLQTLKKNNIVSQGIPNSVVRILDVSG